MSRAKFVETLKVIKDCNLAIRDAETRRDEAAEIARELISEYTFNLKFEGEVENRDGGFSREQFNLFIVKSAVENEEVRDAVRAIAYSACVGSVVDPEMVDVLFNALEEATDPELGDNSYFLPEELGM